MHWRIERPPAKLRDEYTQSGDIAVVVVMAHPKRQAHWEKLRAQLEGNGFAVVVSLDDGGGIMSNAQQVLSIMAEVQAPAHSWCVVVEDDVQLAQGLPARLSALLATIPHGVTGFSLHSDIPSRGEGWRTRRRGEIARTQFAGWRRGYAPRLLEALKVWRHKLKNSHGWDTCCSWALDEDGLKAVISVPSYVQHDYHKVPSLLGNVMAPASRFAEVAPGLPPLDFQTRDPWGRTL
jgi:hypothetical protein